MHLLLSDKTYCEVYSILVRGGHNNISNNKHIISKASRCIWAKFKLLSVLYVIVLSCTFTYTCLCVFVCFQRLQAKVLKLVDISYGGENGFNQAIELSAEVLSNVKFIQEKKLIGE